MAIKFTLNQVEFKIGDSVKVNYKIKEKDKERVQAFDGVIIAVQGKGDNRNFIVQKHASDGIDVERIFPINSPLIDSIKRLRSAKRKIRRSKLYFLRDPKARTV